MLGIHPDGQVITSDDKFHFNNRRPKKAMPTFLTAKPWQPWIAEIIQPSVIAIIQSRSTTPSSSPPTLNFQVMSLQSRTLSQSQQVDSTIHEFSFFTNILLQSSFYNHAHFIPKSASSRNKSLQSTEAQETNADSVYTTEANVYRDIIAVEINFKSKPIEICAVVESNGECEIQFSENKYRHFGKVQKTILDEEISSVIT